MTSLREQDGAGWEPDLTVGDAWESSDRGRRDAARKWIEQFRREATAAFLLDLLRRLRGKDGR